MTLPPQDLPDTMTRDEAMHLIAREWAKNEIVNLKAGHLEMQKQLVEFMGTNQADSKALRELLTSIPVSVANQISACREEMRREVQSDFHSQIEAERMERKIEEKISNTDKTLGKQIAALDAKLSAEIAELKADQAKQWLKIVGPITGVIALAMVVTWVLSAYSKIGLG